VRREPCSTTADLASTNWTGNAGDVVVVANELVRGEDGIFSRRSDRDSTRSA
jgi:hypothetical protein